MSTNYDTIAKEYQRVKLQPWRLHIEAHMVAELLETVTDKAVLDLACGEGFYSRFLKRRGARRVVGVDISTAMIDLARQQEAQHPLGIEYLVQDAAQLELLDQFDLVFAAYLLNYAKTREALLTLYQSIARHLVPGGRFVTVNTSPHATGPAESMREYGFTQEDSAKVDGTPIALRFFQEGGDFEITNYHMSVATHEWALHTAGLRAARWHLPSVSAEGVAQFGHDYWAKFLLHQPIIGLECRK